MLRETVGQKVSQSVCRRRNNINDWIGYLFYEYNYIIAGGDIKEREYRVCVDHHTGEGNSPVNVDTRNRT